MCDVAAFSGEGSGAQATEVPGGTPGWRGAHAAWTDQLRALPEVRGIEQAGDVDRHEVAVRDVQRPVGKGQPPRLGEQMHGLGARFERRCVVRREDGDIPRCEDPEHLRHRDAARRRRRHAADAPALVVGADRFAQPTR